MKTKTLRFRMMVLFCTVVSVLLVASYLAFWGLLAHEIPSQLNHQLQETGRLLIADVAAEPEAHDIERLDMRASLDAAKVPMPFVGRGCWSLDVII